MTDNYEHINYLFSQVTANKCSNSELEEFLEIVNTVPEDSTLIQALDTWWENIPLSTSAASNERKLRMQQRLKELIDKPGVPNIDLKSATIPFLHRIHFLKTTWFRYAAAIIIMLGIGSYLWFTNIASYPINQKNPLNPSSDIPPGSNKAILTLANGQQILLDSTQGNIVKQGKLTVINLAGKLKYEGTGTGTEYNTISTPKGGQYQIVLPDGTKVWLNAASSIYFPTMFVKERLVTITGEAYLEVAADKSKPFYVTIPTTQNNRTTIQVLGTSFNVNAYVDEPAIKTTLLEGAIKIENTILKPGQAYTKGHIIAANIEQDIAWKNGFFNLQDADLQMVMRQLERWYDIQVKYEGPLPEVKFKGGMDRGVHLSGALRLLSQLGVKSRLEGKILIVSKD